jgi:hypothetical protein
VVHSTFELMCHAREIGSTKWPPPITELGRLALMISFTFAMAQARFGLRPDTELNEANAVGTVHHKQGPPFGAESQLVSLLRSATSLRLGNQERCKNRIEGTN